MLPQEREIIYPAPDLQQRGLSLLPDGPQLLPPRPHEALPAGWPSRCSQRALDIDPDYAAAHAGIADCNSHLLDAGDTTITTNEIFEQSERALATRRRRWPRRMPPRASRSIPPGRYEEAEASFERAIAAQAGPVRGLFLLWPQLLQPRAICQGGGAVRQGGRTSRATTSARSACSRCASSRSAGWRRCASPPRRHWRAPRPPWPSAPTMPTRWPSAPACSPLLGETDRTTGLGRARLDHRARRLLHALQHRLRLRDPRREGTGARPAGAHHGTHRRCARCRSSCCMTATSTCCATIRAIADILKTARRLRMTDHAAAADLLLTNWAATTRIAALPEAARPASRGEGYEAAAAVARAAAARWPAGRSPPPARPGRSTSMSTGRSSAAS